MTFLCTAMTAGLLKGCVAEEKLMLKQPVDQGLTILITSAFTIQSPSTDCLQPTLELKSPVMKVRDFPSFASMPY